MLCFCLDFTFYRSRWGPGSSRKGAVLGVAPPALSIWLLPAQTTYPLVQSMTVEAARTAAAAFISCRLDYCNSLLYGLQDTTVQAAVCAECHCTADHWHATQRSYISGIARTPLATHSRARQVQTGMPGSPVAVRAGASLLGRRLPSRVRQHSALSAVS